MALGKQNYVNDGKFYVLRLVREQEDKESGKKIPVEPNQFLVAEKTGEKTYTAIGLEKTVSGDLVQVSIEDDEYEGKPYKKVKLIVKDEANKETYLLDLRMTQLTRNLYNSLLNLTSFDGISISTYLKEGKDKKKYTNISLWQNNELVKGKFPWDQWPQPEIIKNSKGVVMNTDFTEVDEFFVTHLTELAKKINGSSSSKSESVETGLEATSSDEGVTVASDEDLPF